MTRVQELKDEIYLIQSDCSHEWIHQHKVTPIESLVPGTFVGSYQGPIKISIPSIAEKENFVIHLVCEKCSKVFKSLVSSTCPNCLIALKEWGMAPYFRAKYFGIDYIY